MLLRTTALRGQQRVRIATGTIRLLTFFDNFPVTPTLQSKCVYGIIARALFRPAFVLFSHTSAKKGDLFAKQFAIDSEFHVKVVDMQSFFPYNGTGFGSNYRCNSHDQCQVRCVIESASQFFQHVAVVSATGKVLVFERLSIGNARPAQDRARRL
jgi:hypothetical protein